MIETCPPIQNTPQQQAAGLRAQPPNSNLVNNMMKIMHKKGLINDLARVPHHMDLSCAKCIDTINTLLKPLETMTKTLNISSRKRNEILKPISTMVNAAAALTAFSTTASLSSALATVNPIEGGSSSSAATLQAPEVSDASRDRGGEQEGRRVSEAPQQHTSVTSDVAGLNLASDNNIVLGDATGAALDSTILSERPSGDEQMVDLNMTEMEPQQTLPQDIDMLPTNTHHRDLGEDVFGRVIEALQQDGDTDSDDDSEYESQNRIIHIEADNEGDQIHIQIETADDDEDDDDDDDRNSETVDAVLTALGAAHDTHGNGSSGDDEEENESDEEDRTLSRDVSNAYQHESERRRDGEADEEDDDEDDEDDDDDEEDDEDDEENTADEDIVEGSDGRSAESDLSEDEAQANARHATGDTNGAPGEITNTEAGTITDPNVAANGGVVMTTIDSGEVATRHHRRRHRHHRVGEGEENNDDDDDDDEDEDEEDMELDDEENDMDDENEIIEDEEEADEDEEGDDEEDEEDEDDGDEDEDAASEYYDAYNQMLDFIEEDQAEGGDDEDFLTHIENLWQSHTNNANHIVLGHQVNIGNSGNRGYQISVLGGAGSGLGAVDGSLPPHPLSVSAVHPLLVHSLESSGNSSSATGTAIQMGALSAGAGSLSSAISPILRLMRPHLQMQQQQTAQQPAQAQVRPLRMSRFVAPGLQVNNFCLNFFCPIIE